ncbi:Williams Beuren syndrome chromosome region 22 protein [Nowakowskiella sp. JEL0078]|nr:Williams Beuren syndrome chromosome region 22 protein [Nowakowskiella sp. JEL0078]
MSRPEHIAPPEIFYNEDEAEKYTVNSRIQTIQTELTDRAIELLQLPEDESCLLLDIGCGSGLSGEVLDELGHIWVGVDVSPSMLNVAVDREVEGDLILNDIGAGISLRPGMFDGAISISVLQWLCNADKSSHNPQQRLSRFFTTLYTCLTRTARAIFQFYPEDQNQVQLIVSSAMRAGFTGGLVIDYPNSAKAKKWFLCLFTGVQEGGTQMPQARGVEGDTIVNEKRVERNRGRREKTRGKDKKWVLKKKEGLRMKGKSVPVDTKYTARKRGPKF